MDVKNEYIDLNELINVIKKRWIDKNGRENFCNRLSIWG